MNFNIAPKQFKTLYPASNEKWRTGNHEIAKPEKQKITTPLYTDFEKFFLGDDSWVGVAQCAFFVVTTLGILPAIAFFSRENRLAENSSECSKVTDAIHSINISDTNENTALNFMFHLGADNAEGLATLIKEFNDGLTSSKCINIFKFLDIENADREIIIIGGKDEYGDGGEDYIAVKRGAVVTNKGVELMSCKDFLTTLQKYNSRVVDKGWKQGVDLTGLDLGDFKIPAKNAMNFW